MKTFIWTIFILFLMQTPVHAQWVDDWLTQKTVTNPGSFEGQKRHYLNGGSFNARWRNSNDFLISANPPRIKAGCGGIDMFAGALSFMNVEHLVSKLEAMVATAPAVAFDLAFNVLCEPCAKSIKSFEAITDSLNSLQFDDCQASKVLVAKSFQAMGSDNGKIRAMAESDFSLTSGAQDLRKDLTNIWAADNNQPTASDSAQIAGCPTDIKDIFATPGVTVLEAIAIKKGYPAGYIALARGFTGDIEISSETSANGTVQIIPRFIPPCEQNKDDTIDNFFSGQAYQRPSDGGTCTLTTDTNANLIMWSSTQLQNIATKMETATPLIATEENFINSLPLPIYSTLKFAVVTDQTATTIATLSELTARAYAFNMMSDMYHMTTKNIYAAQAIVSKQAQSPGTDCQMDLFEPAIQATGELTHSIHASLRRLQSSYASMTGEINAIMEVAQRFDQFNAAAMESLSQSFSPSLVNMAIGGS